MPLAEYDFSLFEPAAAPAGPAVKPRRQPPRPVRPPKEESLQKKNAKAVKAWKQSLVSYAIVSVTGLCMFLVVQTEVGRHQAQVRYGQLQAQVQAMQQRNADYRTQLERKYSLEIIQDVALNQYHMVPIESGRVVYLNIPRGDQRIQ